MKPQILITPAGYVPVIGGVEQSPAPSLEAAKRRIRRHLEKAARPVEPPKELLTAWEAARHAGVTYPTIIRWVSRGRLIPATSYPDPVTFTRRAVEKAMVDRENVKAGRPRKEGKE